MDIQLKTASFGGYDKKAVETYIEELQRSHDKEVADLKANVLKLSETVKNLHTMREVNLNESTATIDNLKQVNEELQVEVTQLKEKFEDIRQKEDESASRYEAISRTLLVAREQADKLMRETEEQCRIKQEETQAECDRITLETNEACEQLSNETTEACENLSRETTEECERMRNETVAMCEKLSTDTKNACDEMRESTYANCEDLKRRTVQETDTLREQTEYECKTLSEQTAEECEDLRNQARSEAYNVRMSVKRECESLSGYMSQLILSVDNVVKACDETKAVADQAFPELSN